MEKFLAASDIGEISPYPMVVRVIKVKYINSWGCPDGSTNEEGSSKKISRKMKCPITPIKT